MPLTYHRQDLSCSLGEPEASEELSRIGGDAHIKIRSPVRKPTPEDWKQIETLFQQASDLPLAERAAFLEQACQGRDELREEVESLLRSSEEPGSSIEAMVEGAADDLEESSSQIIKSGDQLKYYQVLELIGAGGMGQVYLALDIRLRRRVALKVLLPYLLQNKGTLSRFEQEAQSASTLVHPNIVTVFDFGEAQGFHYLATEYVEGPTLRTMLSDHAVTWQAAVEIAAQIAIALSAAHAQGVIHRDIKPENIIVRADGIVKVLDFGIAKITAPLAIESAAMAVSGATVFNTGPGSVIGTPKYMSPEQARGLEVDSRTDVFSLGSVLYEMIADRPPFSGLTGNDVIADLLRSEPPRLVDLVPEVPEQLEVIVNKALSKEREGRFQTMAEMSDALQQLRHATDLSSRAGSSLARPARPRRKSSKTRLGWSVAAAIIALLAISLGTVHFVSRPAAKSAPVVAGPPSLAVLPFRNIRQDKQNDFLSFSLADAVITELDNLKGLTVRPSTAIDRYRNGSDTPKRIAADLSVDMLLTGSFLRDGDELRVTTQLVRAKTNTILWDQTIDLEYSRLLTVQDQVAQRIIQGLKLELSSDEKHWLQASQRVIDTRAYEYYLRGVDLYSIGNFALAASMLEKSAALEPEYAPTWAYLGRSYTTNGSLAFGGKDNYRRAQVAYEKAIALSPAYAEPRIYMANLFTDTGRVEQAVPLLRGALRSSPNNAEAHWELGYAYRFGGMLEQSLAECERARQLDPEVKLSSSVINTYFYLGRYDQFLQSLPPSETSYSLFYRGLGEYYKGDREQAALHFDRAYQLDPDLLTSPIGKSLGDAIAHHNMSGHRLLRNTEAKILNRGVNDAELIYKVAQAYAVLLDKESALRLLQQSVEGGFFPVSYIEEDPLLSSLHRDVHFERILEQARSRQAKFEKRFFTSHNAGT